MARRELGFVPFQPTFLTVVYLILLLAEMVEVDKTFPLMDG